MAAHEPQKRESFWEPPIFAVGDKVRHYKSLRKGIVTQWQPDDPLGVHILFEDGKHEYRWTTAFELVAGDEVVQVSFAQRSKL